MRWPSLSNAAARLAESVDLPTPPLPLATAITRVSRSSWMPFVRSVTEPRSRAVSALRSSGVITPNSSETRSHAVDRRERLRDLLLEARAQRAAGDRERDPDGHVAAFDADVADHVELDDVALQLRVDHLLERLQDRFALRVPCPERSPTSFRPARRRGARRPPASPRRRSASGPRGRAAPRRTAVPRAARSRGRARARAAARRRCRPSARALSEQTASTRPAARWQSESASEPMIRSR